MKFICELSNDLPKLSWICICQKISGNIYVYHGSCVEVKKDMFCIAGIWDGEFAEGDFDKTDIVAGTGIRFRGNRVIFVPPGNTIDRIISYMSQDYLFVSNSFSALLEMCDIELIDAHDYEENFETIAHGLEKYTKKIPTESGDIRLTYYNNLVYNGNEVYEVRKPCNAPHFNTFNDYYNYLLEVADSISNNVKDKGRKKPLPIISTISSGYDSPVATVIAKFMGLEKAVTIEKAASWLNRSDSGAKIAEALSIPCECYEAMRDNYPLEETLWAAMGHANDLHMSVFDYPEPVCLMITAFHGDLVWEKDHYDISEFLVRHSTSAASLTEFALHRGVINCSIAFWAIQNVHEIQKIWRLDEMKPWTLDTEYDRPVPRRIVEEAGVPREIYAARKTTSANSVWSPNPLPLSKCLQKEYKAYLKDRGFKVPFKYERFIWQLIAAVEWHLLEPTRNFVKSDKFPSIPFAPRKRRWLLFHWANEKVRRNYTTSVEYIWSELKK